MKKFRKIVVMFLFVGIACAMIAPSAFATTYNVQNVSWNCSTWVNGRDSGNLRSFDKGQVVLLADESVSGISGTFTVSEQLKRFDPNKVKFYDYGIYSQDILVGSGGLSNPVHIGNFYNTDTLSSNYFFVMSITPQGIDNVSGSGKAYNLK